MRTQLKSFVCAAVLITFLSIGVKAAVKTKSETVVIQTSAICESCKARIEKALKSTDGVQTASLNLSDKKVKVKFDPDKTSADKIRTVISNTGYDADNVKKNEAGYGKLPHCCQKPDKADMH